MIKKYRAYFEAHADTNVDFEIDTGDLTGDELRDALEDEAYKHFQGITLCHQCSRHLNLGDFEIGADGYSIEEV